MRRSDEVLRHGGADRRRHPVPSQHAVGLHSRGNGRDRNEDKGQERGHDPGNDRPVNVETPPHNLNDDVTPTSLHFIGSNGIQPEDTNPENWMLTIDGFVNNPLKLSIADLKCKFEVVTRKIMASIAAATAAHSSIPRPRATNGLSAASPACRLNRCPPDRRAQGRRRH